MALTPPPDSPASYYPPATLSWNVADGDIYLEIPLSIELCNTLEDEDITTISDTVEVRLKALYPALKIARVLSWKPSAPAAETQTVVQEAQPREPSPDEPPAQGASPDKT